MIGENMSKQAIGVLFAGLIVAAAALAAWSLRQPTDTASVSAAATTQDENVKRVTRAMTFGAPKEPTK
jgi:predicted negative regulator of RcsB-dependent stress response